MTEIEWIGLLEQEREALHHGNLDQHVSKPETAEVRDEATLEDGRELPDPLPPEHGERKQDEEPDEERGLGQDQELGHEHDRPDVVLPVSRGREETTQLVVLVEERLVVRDDRDVEGIAVDESLRVSGLQAAHEIQVVGRRAGRAALARLERVDEIGAVLAEVCADALPLGLRERLPLDQGHGPRAIVSDHHVIPGIGCSQLAQGFHGVHEEAQVLAG